MFRGYRPYDASCWRDAVHALPEASASRRASRLLFPVCVSLLTFSNSLDGAFVFENVNYAGIVTRLLPVQQQLSMRTSAGAAVQQSSLFRQTP